MHRLNSSLLALAVAAGPLVAAAQSPVEEPAAPPAETAPPELDPGLSAMALFELDQELRTETRVASQRAKNIRETPGVVTVITREDIQLSGARDLIDVLRLVPGFAFGVDVEGAVGVGFRGAWGHEGKVLLLIDGQEMNETLYSTLQFGGHYPLHDVQRVEIIRGPGSATYGGNAELAVINVVTRSAKELNGAQAGVTYGRYPSAFARRSVHLSAGREVGALALTGSALIGQGQRSDAVYRDFYGNEFGMADNARTDPMFLNLGASYHDLHLRFLYDNHTIWTRDEFAEALEEPSRMRFKQVSADARYDLKPSDRITLTPRLTWRRHVPWNNPNEDGPIFYDKVADRLTGRLTLAVDVTDALNLVVGGEAYLDRAIVRGPEGALNGYFDGEPEVTYQNRAVFAEALYEHWLANLVAGARFEHHSAVGASFVPRIAVTKLVDRFHAKVLYSRAFRAPGIENIALADNDDGSDIRPERTGVFEAEAGYQITEQLFLRANVFDISIQDPIVYFFDEVTEAEGYRNYSRTGTRGVEAEVRFRRKNVSAQLSYSLYRAQNNEVESYEVPDRPELLLGFPTHKVTFAARVNPWGNLHVSPTAIFLSPRHGYLSGEDGESEVEATKPAVLLNLFVTWRDLGVEGLELGAGVYDLLNQGTPFLQPYAGGHAPLPGPRRELLARLQYTYAFD